MKSVILLIAFLFTIFTSYAQWSNKFSRARNKHFVFGSGDFISGNYKGGDISFNYVYNNKYSVKLGISLSEKSTESMPNDYLKSGQAPSSIGINSPNESLENVHLMFGRVFSLHKKDWLRLTIQGGPGISSIREPIFIKKASTQNSSSRNYGVEYQKTNYFSFIVNPKIEFPFTCNLGVSAGPMLVVNEQRRFLGASIGFIYGFIGCKSIK